MRAVSWAGMLGCLLGRWRRPQRPAMDMKDSQLAGMLGCLVGAMAEGAAEDHGHDWRTAGVAHGMDGFRRPTAERELKCGRRGFWKEDRLRVHYRRPNHSCSA